MHRVMTETVGTAPYDAWIHWTLTYRCNLRCSYCFRDQDDAPKTPLQPIRIQPLLDTLAATGRTFKVGFTGGGEPFLVPNIVDACRALTASHYIRFNTNLTPSRVAAFAEQIDPSRVTHIHASLHIEELKSRKLLDRFVHHYRMLTEKGFDIAAIEVAHPSYAPHAADLRREFSDRGVTIRFGLFNGTYQGRAYPAAYTPDELDLFGLQHQALEPYASLFRVCNAGYNVMIAQPDGSLSPCIGIHADLGNLYSGIRCNPRLAVCPLEHCGCPLNSYDQELFRRALAENNSRLERLRLGCRRNAVRLHHGTVPPLRRGLRRCLPAPMRRGLRRLIQRP
jgi:MoaA/NifB/PqqE/SkfB family radical SAM enzyme